LWVYDYVSKMKATIYLTYKPVNNNINVLLRDAQKLTYEHVIKADDILEQPYLNPLKKYTVCSIRWMGMQLLIPMQLIVRSISLPVPFILCKAQF
jgi:gliding motility-associated lipoprotein GldD